MPQQALRRVAQDLPEKQIKDAFRADCRTPMGRTCVFCLAPLPDKPVIVAASHDMPQDRPQIARCAGPPIARHGGLS